mmetsp:Transcript_4275/g.8223  ORF Transcript_4275/g.8223 Transcript_4275/m.8223 type:complete len:512 (-) Transcript_4275:46-1581(-)
MRYAVAPRLTRERWGDAAAHAARCLAPFLALTALGMAISLRAADVLQGGLAANRSPVISRAPSTSRYGYSYAPSFSADMLSSATSGTTCHSMRTTGTIIGDVRERLMTKKSKLSPEVLVERHVHPSWIKRAPLKVAIIGSGNWGSAIATVIGQNTLKYPVFKDTTTMWVFEEEYEGRNLTSIINDDHVNAKYLPGVELPHSVRAESSLIEAARDADILVFVTPHQFVRSICERLKGIIKPDAVAVSLIKGFEVVGGPQHCEPDTEKVAAAGGAEACKEMKTEIRLISEVVNDILNIPCAALSGANIAHDIAHRQFSESTIGCESHEDTGVLQLLFDVPYFKIGMVKDVEGVQIYGSLKNIVALGAGFVDGLGLDSNTKAAIIRMGVEEMRRFTKVFYPSVQRSTMWDSCGIADVITTCYGGRNRRCAEAFVRGGSVTWSELENTMLNGQKLQGVLTAAEVFDFLSANDYLELFPFFHQVHKICKREEPPESIVGAFASEDLRPSEIEWRGI